jgi:anaerobic selenocysteine-containing dehydrogenase
LYDAGVAISRSPVFANVGVEPQLRVSPADFARLGVGSGANVRITSSRTTISLPVVADPAVPNGVAAIPFTADGDGAAMLIDSSASVTDVRVETKL